MHFLWPSRILRCLYAPHLLYPLPHQRTCGLLPCLGSCKQQYWKLCCCSLPSVKPCTCLFKWWFSPDAGFQPHTGSELPMLCDPRSPARLPPASDPHLSNEDAGPSPRCASLWLSDSRGFCLCLIFIYICAYIYIYIYIYIYKCIVDI